MDGPKIDQKDRRKFLKNIGLGSVLLTPGYAPASSYSSNKCNNNPESKQVVNFIFDGLALSPSEYMQKLQEIDSTEVIEIDWYGKGGPTSALEEKFQELTGKEKAIYLPTGTMANQLALKILNGNSTKAIVPENSHIYRDEADAAQSVHNKRLIPVGKGKPHFRLDDLIQLINYTESGEVFKSGLGTIAIENPVRRADGAYVPLETIKEISDYCKANNYKLHLDGARIHITSAYTGISIKTYSQYFDTVYISLYKYLNATGGAILCGDAEIIEQMEHNIKILGGTVYQSWPNTAVALHYLKTIDEIWESILSTSATLIKLLNQNSDVQINSVKNGTNIYHLNFNDDLDSKVVARFLHDQHNIWIGRANENGIIKFVVNQSILSRPISELLDAWNEAIVFAKA